MPVGLVRHSGGALDERHNWSLADHFVLESSGRWLFRVGPGTYGLVAFEVKRGRRVSTHRTVPPLDNDSASAKVAEQKEEKIKRFFKLPARMSQPRNCDNISGHERGHKRMTSFLADCMDSLRNFR